MLDLLKLMDDRSAPVIQNIRRWFGQYLNAVYTVMSDYCVGNTEKANDVFSLSVIVNHDRLDEIQRYINAVAPSDLKSCRTVSPGLMQYLKCPIIFSLSFVVSRSSRLLRHYATDEAMNEFVPDALELLEAWQGNSPGGAPGFDEIRTRLLLFQADVKRRNFNSNLARQVHIVGACAALVFRFFNVAV